MDGKKQEICGNADNNNKNNNSNARPPGATVSATSSRRALCEVAWPPWIGVSARRLEFLSGHVRARSVSDEMLNMSVRKLRGRRHVGVNMHVVCRVLRSGPHGLRPPASRRVHADRQWHLHGGGPPRHRYAHGVRRCRRGAMRAQASSPCV